MKYIAFGIVLILTFSMANVVQAASSASIKSNTIVWNGTVQVKKTYTVQKRYNAGNPAGQQDSVFQGNQLGGKGNAQGSWSKGRRDRFYLGPKWCLWQLA